MESHHITRDSDSLCALGGQIGGAPIFMGAWRELDAILKWVISRCTGKLSVVCDKTSEHSFVQVTNPAAPTL